MLIKLPIISGFIIDDFNYTRYPVKFIESIANVVVKKDTYAIVEVQDNYTIPNLSGFLYILYNKGGLN